jgi:hypothetical protein
MSSYRDRIAQIILADLNKMPTHTEPVMLQRGRAKQARVRCDLDNKVVFESESAATEASRKASVRYDKTMEAFQGHCGHWHMRQHRDTPSK